MENANGKRAENGCICKARSGAEAPYGIRENGGGAWGRNRTSDTRIFKRRVSLETSTQRRNRDWKMADETQGLAVDLENGGRRRTRTRNPVRYVYFVQAAALRLIKVGLSSLEYAFLHVFGLCMKMWLGDTAEKRAYARYILP